MLCSTGAILFASNAASTEYDLNNEYRLSLTDYAVPDYSDTVRITDPNGSATEVKDGKIALLVCGEYKINYGKDEKGNDLIKKVYVFANIPDVTFKVAEEFSENYSAGKIITFPVATIENIYRNFSDYNVEIYKDNKLLKTVKNSLSKQGKYFFSESGDYKVSYTVTDDFNKKWSKDFSVAVIDKEDIFYDILPSETEFGTTLNVGFPYGYYKGEEYAVTVKVTSPSGTSEVLNSPFLNAEEVGEYLIEYSSEINGKKLSYVQRVDVVTVESAFSFVKGTGVVGEEETALPYYADEYATGLTGRLLTSEQENVTFYYNDIIDLKQLTKDDNVIEFMPYSSGTDVHLGYIRIKMTDIYDATNTVTAYLFPNPYTAEHTNMLVEFNGITGGINNDPGVYGKFSNNYGTILYYASLYGDVFGKSRTICLRYSESEKAVYTFSRNNEYNYGTQIVLDLDNSSYIPLDSQFKGFTTGEVYLSVELTSNKSAGMYITEIAGEKVKLNENLSDVMISFNGKHAGYPGATDYEYRLPVAVRSSACVTDAPITLKVFKGDKDCSDLLEGSVFRPEETGEYVARYSMSYMGKNLVKTFSFEIVDAPNDIFIALPSDETASYGERYFIPDVSVSGGSGELILSYRAELNGEEIEPDVFGGYLADSTGVMEIFIKATDEINFSKTSSYQVTINEGIISELDSVIAKSVRINQEYVFPDFTVLSVKNNAETEIINKKIVITYGSDGVVELVDGDYALTVPACDKLCVSYQAEVDGIYVVVGEYVLDVLPERLEDSENLFIYDGMTALTLENGLLFRMPEERQKYEISFPNVLSVNNFYCKFAVIENSDKFENFEIIFTDIDYPELKLSIQVSGFDFTAGTAKLTVNGIGEESIIQGTKGKFSADADDSGYVGKNYMYFEISFAQGEGVVKNSTTDSVSAYVTKFENGRSYTEFTKNVSYFGFAVNGARSGAEVLIGAIGNQQINYSIENNGNYEDNDNVGPEIVVYGNSAFYNAYLGEVYTVAKAAAFDVIQSVSYVTVSLIDPDGNYLVKKNSTADIERQVTLEKYGYYRLEYTAYDYVGRKNTLNIRIVVKDTVPPEITVKGNYEHSYRTGQEITVLGADLRDDVTATDDIGLIIYIRGPRGFTKAEAGAKYIFDQAGEYEIIYFATDDWNNVTRLTYEITVGG